MVPSIFSLRPNNDVQKGNARKKSYRLTICGKKMRCLRMVDRRRVTKRARTRQTVAEDGAEREGDIYGRTRPDGICRGVLGMFSISSVFR